MTVSEHTRQVLVFKKGYNSDRLSNREEEELAWGICITWAKLNGSPVRIYGQQEQGHKSDADTGAGAAHRRSTVLLWQLVTTGLTGK